MSNREYEIFLFDIIVAVTKIELVVGRYSSIEELQYNFMAWDSLMREYEIIGEAINILMKEGILDSSYRPIVDFRNKIIHHYFGVDPEAVWGITTSKLPELKVNITQTYLASSSEIQKEIEMDALEELRKTPQVVKNVFAYIEALK